MSNIENYGYYLRELEAQDGAPPFVPTIDQPRTSTEIPDEPVLGFWRIMAAKTKPDAPVAIWQEGENGSAVTWCKIGRRTAFNLLDPADPNDATFLSSSFLKCSAVTEERYNAALESGMWWDGKPSRSLSLEEQLGIPPITGEEQGELHEILQDVIDRAVEKANALPVGSVAEADIAMALVDRLSGLYTYAGGKQEVAELPFATAFNTEHAKWVFVPDAEKARKALKARVQKFLTDEQNRLQALADKATADKLAAAQKQAEDLGMDPAEVEVQEVKAEKVTAGASHGRSISAGSKKWIGKITDVAKLAAHLIEIKDADLLALFQKKADAAARTMKSETPIPGVTGKQVDKE